ncbi:MAG TPA: hypothetical protein VND20_10615 [Candidatus Binataceae bacterium]|nr:hypothetical protein [Candidatus Binataceae bacterium]
MTEIELENAHLRRRLADLEARVAALRTPLESDALAELAQLQSRADAVAAKFGEVAPSPMRGERPDAFRVRVLRGLQRHSPTFADFDLARADAALLNVAEREIYQAAERVASSGTDAAAPLVKVEETDGAGRRITHYFGDPLAWMSPFMSGGQVCRVIRPGLKP